MGELLTEHDGGGGVDGEGSGGQTLSRQGAGTGPSDPRNLVSMAAELWNFSWNMTLVFRVFQSGGIYRRKGKVGGHPGGPHHVVARPGGPAPPYGVAASSAHFVSPLDSVYVT